MYERLLDKAQTSLPGTPARPHRLSGKFVCKLLILFSPLSQKSCNYLHIWSDVDAGFVLLNCIILMLILFCVGRSVGALAKLQGIQLKQVISMDGELGRKSKLCSRVLVPEEVITVLDSFVELRLVQLSVKFTCLLKKNIYLSNYKLDQKEREGCFFLLPASVLSQCKFHQRMKTQPKAD